MPNETIPTIARRYYPRWCAILSRTLLLPRYKIGVVLNNKLKHNKEPSTNSYAAAYGYVHDFGFDCRELKATRKD